MVFIHGESFEWNSGNPYDGTVLAAYGNVVFVTINFRLGILGFLRPGTSDDAASNFGLLDQTAALLWLKENIAKFGGDPDSVTLVGHGTGAILANLLLISPVANNKGLFKRAILMSGSALSADAIGKAPLQITKQVAYALNCPTTNDNELARCLRNRDVESLLNVRIDKPRYVPAYAPLIDRAVIPKKPLKLMENAQLFGSFDLMYGITESEKFHILPPVAVLHGMLDGQRDEVLRDHAKATHELEPELVVSRVLEHYASDSLDNFSDEYPTKNRDIVLDALSDSGVVAPLMMAARLHARANPKSYMYVFSHPRAMYDYSGRQRQHTVHGEELPYILGVPLDGGKYHLRGRYNIGETLFSEAMMTWWCSFAYTGIIDLTADIVELTVQRIVRFNLPDGNRLFYTYKLQSCDITVAKGREKIGYALSFLDRVSLTELASEISGYEYASTCDAYKSNPNAPRRMTYITDGPKEWRQYQLDWPEYNIANETYFNLTIPPRIGRKYRSLEMQFWNEDVPNLIRHKPRGPRPQFLDRADGIGKYGNGSSFKTPDGLGMKYTTSVPNNLDSGGDGYSATNEQDGPSDRFPYSRLDVNSKQDQNQSTTDESILKGSSVITMVIGFGVVFLLINLTAFFWLYHRRQGLKSKQTSSAKKSNRRHSNQKEEGSGGFSGSRKIKGEKQPENLGELSRKCDSKPDINEVVKSDKAYDNNSNFGRQSKLSRHNSSSTIDTHIKVKEWIQQEIVHRCSPRFLRKTRETLQKEHQEKLTKQQQHDEAQRRKLEEEKLRVMKQDPIYDHDSTMIVRPGGKQSKIPKVSVAIDATPATRTESILNQIPIELAKELGASERLNPYEQQCLDCPMAPQVVVIEHHHSRSDPLPMETVFKNIKSHHSTTRACDSDSGSAINLYARINPKFKSKLPSNQLQSETLRENSSNDMCDGSEIIILPQENIYERIPKMTTFGGGQKEDINVTCREPIMERENISPEEALKTIKRRNYPKVLPDIEKRLSLPAPSSLLMSKQFAHSLIDHRKGPHPSCIAGCAPQPPPRIFGTSKSLDLPEEDEKEPITTNLHVGPLLKRQDSIGNNRSDSSIVDTIERVTTDAQNFLSNHRNRCETEYTTPNPTCPVHGSTFLYSDEARENASTSRSADGLDRNINDHNNWYKELNNSCSPAHKGVPNISLPNVNLGNPNWYKTIKKHKNDENAYAQYGNPDDIPLDNTVIPESVEENLGNGLKIVITPKITNIPSTVNVSTAQNQNIFVRDSETVITSKVPQAIQFPSVDGQPTKSDKGPMFFQTIAGSNEPSVNVIIDNKNETLPGITSTGSLKQPKIIIKPNTNFQRNKEQHIPRVSAIPSSEVQMSQITEKEVYGGGGIRLEKPPIKEKPKVTRIPSFSRRKDERILSADKTTNPIYSEKIEIVQRINALPNSAATTTGSVSDNKSSIPTTKKEPLIAESTIINLSSNTGTIKRRLLEKKSE
ncbi:hypothetical protein PV328_009550 [Microctonus aethiopoides]|nr:hypothetical protein PV328_009550 [Microctonus aethiopoides]